MKKNYNQFKGKETMQLALKLGLLILILLTCTVNLYAQQTFTFTPAGATGAGGPSQTQVNSAYLSTNLAGSVVATGGIQSFTIPASGLYLLDITGAQGGNTNSTYNRTGGLGSRMQGTFNMLVGDVLTILVGQQGVNGVGTGGGGGGSYVVRNGVLQVAAGGGGGPSSDVNGVNAVTVTAGTADSPAASLGGTNGSGGGACSGTSYNAGGGGGYIAGASGNGANATGGGFGGLSYLNGGTGGSGGTTSPSFGGFGGGGGANVTTVGGGGGGGYSGGAGGMLGLSPCTPGLRSGGGGGGSYNAGLTQTNTPGINTGDGKVILKQLCNIGIISSGSNSLTPFICSGTSLTLTTDAASNYTWSTGNTTTTSIVVSPMVTTTYSIIGTSTANCVASAAITITVNTGPPVLSINASTTQICLGKTATLTASGAISYVWTGGITNGVSFMPSVTSTYSVTGQNGCGNTTTFVTIAVSPLPVSGISSPSVICNGQSAALTLTAAANSFSWQPNNVITTVPNTVVAPLANTIYTVTASDGTCSGTTTLSVVSNPIPTLITTSTSQTICPGETSTLTVSGALSYTWNTTPTSATIVAVSPTINTLYTVVGINSFSCLGNSSQVILVKAQPTITIVSPATLVCSGKSTTLTASGANNYTWTNGPQTSTNVVSLTQNTTYTVSGVYAGSVCVGQNTIAINVFTPTLSISGNTAICLGNSINLTPGGGSTFTWTPNNQSPTVNTIYTLSAVSNSAGVNCLAQKTIEIAVNPLPTITAVASKTSVCRNQTTTITAGGASTYVWNNLTSTLSTNAVMTASSSISTTLLYTVTGTDGQGCSSTKNISISVLGCNGIEEGFLAGNGLQIFPNPNNGQFIIRTLIARDLVLVNELGQVIKKIRTNAENEYAMSVTDLANGIYFLTDPTPGSSFSEKIIVEK